MASMLLSSILMNIFTPLYTWTVESDFAMKLYPFNKNIVFILLFIQLIICTYLMKITKY